MPIAPLPAEALYRRCDESLLPFETTAELPDLSEPFGQDRAVEAIRFGIGIRAHGFNLFALGPEGTGKSSMIRQYLTAAATDQNAPDDWVYVNNFDKPHKPWALRLPPGCGPELKKGMETLVEDLGLALPAVFESEEYRTRKQVIEAQFKEYSDNAFATVQAQAAEHSIALLRTPVGFALAPMRGEEVLSPEDFQKLPEDEQKTFREHIARLQEQLEQALKALPQHERESREKLRRLDQETAQGSVDRLMENLRRRWQDHEGVSRYLDAVRDDVIEHVGDFLDPDGGEERHPNGPVPRKLSQHPAFRRYQVNLLVTNGHHKGAPVVFEDNPTMPSLVGRAEHIAQFGALLTDFTLIKGGSLHRANGGYLVIEAHKLLMQPFAWEALKRALRGGRITIEGPGENMGLLSTVSLEPEPIPLDVKVVLTGEPMLYYTLSHYDPEFSELFKVAADFDWRTERTEAAIQAYARLAGTLSRQEKLRPLHRGAVARIIEHASRLAEDVEKLSTHMASLGDLVREADYWAGQEGADIVERRHIQKAIDAHSFRSDRVRSHILEEIHRGTVLIDTSGEVCGQINGLAVMELGRFSFGHPSRITCRVHPGKGEVLDIEREVEMGGPLHSKGVMILSAFLASRFALKGPLSLSASLVFEQSYGGIDGDSASSTELYALLSALSELPIRQNLAVTGSVNQFGQVQAIGGVNEKIEGFFDVCKARGLDGSHGVLIPASNVKHLMLRTDVAEACAQGLFHIYPVETIDQGIELLTGVEAGLADEKGDFPLGSVNRRVAARLNAFTRILMANAPGEERRDRSS
ncbi:Lon protease family protein [Telmatospirillum sp. J64-1]|uniref:Lon protease family protein n=1 Tax=Telmatospirillum sp. J64-1 TaxID=2502183 RepID=UPI00115E892A|nr:ATP-binding protein [Telmatospirillum sp. J64-1]